MVDIPVLMKRSSTPDATPIAGDLQPGELAINYEDGKLFFKNTSNVVTLLADAAQIGGGGPDFSDFTGDLDFQLLGNNWSQIGNKLTIEGGSYSGLTKLGDDQAVHYNSATGEIKAYSFDGTNWSQLGNASSSFFNTALGAVNISTLDSSNIAIFGENLETWNFDGTNWSQVGNSKSVGTVRDPSITTIAANRVSVANSNNNELRAYDWDGTDWNLVGNAFTLPAFSSTNSQAKIGENKIAHFDDAVEDLIAYEFDGTNWSQVGNALNISGSGIPTLSELSDNKVVFADTTNEELRIYAFDGTNWALESGTFSLPSGGRVHLGLINQNRIAYFDSTNDQLTTYDLSAGGSFIEDPNTTGILDTLLNVGSLFRISGSTSNDELFKTLEVVNTNKIKVSSVVDEGPLEVSLMVDKTFEGVTTDQISEGTNNKYYPSADQSKLAGIESGATADQTGAEIKTAYEAEADTNAFTDAEKSKLTGIESGAEVNTINSDPSGVTGADQVTNVMTLTQAEYDAIGTPDATTLYFVVDTTNKIYLGATQLF